MGGGGEKKENDLYAVLGLEKECSSTDLKSAYRMLAKKWHPDRCSASGSSNIVEEAKNKFQDIQEAYSVLSDENKRLLYDLGMYDQDDDENNYGMGDFLSEMVATMSQIKPTSENGEGSFKEFQDLFDEIIRPDQFQAPASTSSPHIPISSPSPYSSSYTYSASDTNNKRSFSVAASSSSLSPFSATTAFSHTLSGKEQLGNATEEARDTSSSSGKPSWNGRRRRVSPIDVEDFAESWTKP